MLLMLQVVQWLKMYFRDEMKGYIGDQLLTFFGAVVAPVLMISWYFHMKWIYRFHLFPEISSDYIPTLLQINQCL
jgi:hypothetical protein